MAATSIEEESTLTKKVLRMSKMRERESRVKNKACFELFIGINYKPFYM